jgi:putative membrane protein
MKIIVHWFLHALAIIIAAYLLPGIVVKTLFVALVLAVVLGLLNAIIRPLLLIITLPINILTLGLFTFVINAALVMLASEFVKGFYVYNFWWALVFSLLLSLINSFLHHFEKREEE